MMCHLSHHPSITTMYNYYSTRHVLVIIHDTRSLTVATPNNSHLTPMLNTIK